MDQALDSDRLLLEENPHDLEALARLEAELYKRNDYAGLTAIHGERAKRLSSTDAESAWARFVQALEQRAEAADDPLVESDICLALGRVHEEHQGLYDQAMVRYQRAFKLNPRQVEALRAARAIYWLQENWKLVLQLFTLELQVTSAAEGQADLYFQMAELCRDRLGETGDAAACARSAMRLSPDHPRAAEFESLVASAVGQALAEFEALVAQAEATRDPRQRVALQLKAAEGWVQQQPDDPRLEALLQQVLATDPRNEQGRALLDMALQLSGRWRDLSMMLEGRIESTQRKPDRLALLLKLAEIARGPLGDIETAARWYREALNLEPGEGTALGFCVDFYSDASRWTDLVAVYEGALRSRARAGSEGAMLVQIAMLLWKKVGDLEQAENYFKRVKLNDPKNIAMLQFYAEYYAAQSDWKKLIATLTARQQVETSVEARVDIGLRMAQVAEDQLENPEKAIDTWKSILKLKADYEPARTALRRLFTQTQKWNALLEFLKEDLNLVVGDDSAANARRVSVYLQMIEIYRDRLSLDVMVVNTYNQVLQVDPNNAEALDALETRFEESARWNDLIGILKRRADAARSFGDDEGFISLQRRMAVLWTEKFSNPNQAIAHLEAVLELRPSDDAAIAQLIDTYRHRKDWRPLFSIYRRQLDVLDGTARVERLIEMARIAADRLDERDEAIALWREVIAADPTEDKAWQALEQLFHKAERWADLAQLFAEQSARVDDAGARVGWLKRLGNVYAERLHDEDRAAETWRAVLSASPGDLHAENYLRELYLRRSDWDAVEALYAERRDWDGLVRLLAARAAESGEVSVRVELYRRIARVCAVELKNEATAIECWERVLREDPAQTEAAQILAPHYAQTEQWDALVYTLELMLAYEPERPIDVMTDLAQVHEQRRGDLAQAYQYWARALTRAPETPELLDEARRTAALVGRQDVLCELLATLCEQPLPPTDEARLRGALAEMCAEDLGRFADAATHLERVRALLGDRDTTLEALVVLYQRSADWDALLNTLEAQLERASADGEKVKILRDIASLQENTRDDPSAAQGAFEQLLVLDERDVEALRGLQRLAERAGDESALVGYLEDELALVSEPSALAALLYRIGQIEERRGASESALNRYARALDQVPDHSGAMSALEQALSGPSSARAAEILEPFMRLFERWSGLRQVLELQVDASEDPSFRMRVLREVATLREERLSDTAGAFQTWQRLLLEDRQDGSVVASLERLASALSLWEPLAEQYATFALGGSRADDDIATASEFSRRLVRVLEERLGMSAAARTQVERIIAAQGEDPELLDSLDRLSARLEDWTAVVDVCERKLALLELPEARIQLLHRLADLYEVVLEQPEHAVEAYRRVVSEDPARATALDALDRLYRHLGRWDELANLLQVRLDDADDAARMPLSFQLATVLEAHLGRDAEALERYADVLALSPDHDPTLAALARLIERQAGPAGAELRRRACDVLEPVFVARDAWAHEVALLRIRLDDAESPADRVALRRRIAARVEAGSGDAATAFTENLAAFDEASSDAAILEELERLVSVTSAWPEFVEALERASASERAVDLEPAYRARLLTLSARARAEQLGDLLGAISDWRRVLEDLPEELEALRALDALFERTGQPAELVDVIRRRAALCEDAEARAAMIIRLAELQETALRRIDDAIDTFVGLRMEASDTDVRAHAALARLYAELERWDALVEVLEDYAERTPDLDERAALRFKAAQVYEVRLGRPAEAVRCVRAVLDDAPGDTKALAELDRLLTAMDDVVGLVEALELRAAAAQDAPSRHAFDARRAAILRGPLGETERAIEIYRSILAETPDFSDARAALAELVGEPAHRLPVSQILAPLYEHDADWPALRALLVEVLPDLDTEAARIERLLDIAALDEEKLGEPARALSARADAWRLSGADAALEPELERLAGVVGAWRPLLDLLLEGIELSPERTVALRMKRATLLRDALNDIDGAIAELRALLEAEPECLEALDTLDALFGQTGHALARIEVIDRKVALTTDDAAQVALLHRVARLYEQDLSDLSNAVETHRRVVLVDPQESTSLDELERLLAQLDRSDELAAVLEHRVGLATSPEARVTVELKLAAVCERGLRDGRRALELYRDALEAVPSSGAARVALRRLFDDVAFAEEIGLERVAVAAALEPCYRADKDWVRLVDVLEVQQAAEPDAVTRFDALRELVAIYESYLSDSARAFDAAARAFELQPEHAENRAALRRLGEAAHETDRLAACLDAAAGDSSDAALKATLLLELGRVHEALRSDDGAARAAFAEVLALDPENAAALSALNDLFTRTAAWSDLVQLYSERAEATSDAEEKKALLLKVCQLLEDVLEDIDQTIVTWRRVLDVEPDYAPAFRALERDLTRQARWTELAELRREELQHVSDSPRRADLMHRLAELLDGRLDETDAAIEQWATLLSDEDPAYAPAVRGLERLLLERAQSAPESPSRRRIAEILEPVYEGTAAWPQWLGVLEVQLSFEHDRWQRIERLSRIADGYENRARALPAAFDAWVRAFELDFGNADIVKSLDRLAEATGSWEALVAAYRSQLDAMSDVESAVALRCKVARVLDERLGRAADAIGAFQQVLTLDDANAEAIGALERLLASERRPAELVEVLVRKAEASRDVLERKELYYRVCELCEASLGDIERAISTYQRVLDEDSEDQNAVEALIRLFERSGQWSQLVGALREKLDLASDASARKQVMFRIARVCEEHLSDVDETIQTYRAVIELDPQDRLAVESLDRLYSHEARWGELVDLLEQDRAFPAEDAEAHADAIDLRIADTLERHLGQIDQAVELYAELLARRPGEQAAVDALERIVREPQHRLAAAKCLEVHYAGTFEFERLGRALEAQLVALDDRSERVEVLKRLATLQAEQLTDQRSAFDTSLRAFEEDPSDEIVIVTLERLADELQAHAALAQAFERQSSESVDATVVSNVKRRFARLCEDKLADPERAVAAWDGLLRADPYDREALTALDRLYQAAQRWDALIEVLRREIDLGGQADEGDLRFRLGYLLEVVRGDLPAALDLYRGILVDHPEHVYAVEAMERLAVHVELRGAIAEILEPVYRHAGAFGKLCVLAEMRIELATNARERAELWMTSAELREGKLQDADGALECMLRAFEEAPEDEDVRKRLVRVATERGAWARLADAFDAVRSRVSDPELRVSDLLQVADWSRGRLRDPLRAAARFVEVLSIEPENARALDALEEIYADAEVWPRLAEVYRRKADLAFEADEKRQRLVQLAELCADRLGDATQAAAAWDDVLALDPSDNEALSALEALHEMHGNGQALFDTLRRRTEATYDATELAGIYRRMAVIARDDLGRPADATEALEKVLEYEPDDASVYDDLRALYANQQDWDRLQDVLVKALAAADSDDARMPLLAALSENAEVRLGRVDTAIEYQRQRLSISPADHGAMDALTRLYASSERWFDLVEALREHIETLDAVRDRGRLLALRTLLADIAHSHLQDADTAIESLNVVLDLEPDNARALTVLAQLYERSGEWSRCAETLTRALAHAAPGQERADAQRRLGILCLERLDRPEEARAALESAVAESGDAQALDALVRLSEEQRNDAALFQWLDARARQVSRDTSARAADWVRLATLHAAAGDAARRIECLEAATALNGQDARISDALLEAYIAAGRAADAEPVLRRTVERLKAERRFKEVFPYNFQLGRVAEERGDDLAALALYQECFDYDATYLPNLMRLGKLLFKLEMWDRSLKVFTTMLLHQNNIESAEQRVEIFYHLGVLRLKTDDARKAKDMFNRALGIDPDHAPSRAALESL